MEVDFSNKELYNYKYIPFFHNKQRYNFLMWGWWSWKSKAEAQKEIMKSFELWNRLLWVRKVKDTIKDSIYTELVQVIQEWKLEPFFEITKSPMYIRNTTTWSDFIFRWLDDVEKIKSVSKVTRIWIEEATEIEKAEFDQLDIRLRWIWKELQITCTYNPVSDEHWLITDFWNLWSTKNVYLLHSTYKDNRFVDQVQYWEIYERIKEKDINLYNIYALWIPGKAVEWLIYTYTIIAELPKEAKLSWYWLDFWFTHNACLLWIYEWNWWIILDEVFHRPWLITKDIIWILEDEKIDPSDDIIWDSSRPEAIQEIRQAWFSCKPCIKWAWSVADWISFMKWFTIYVTARSRNSIKDFNNYIRDKNKQDTPVKLFDEAPDAWRYWVTEFFKWSSDFIFE